MRCRLLLARFGRQLERAGFLLHIDGDFPQNGKDQQPHPVHAETDDDFGQRGRVVGEGFKGRGREAADDQAKALVDPRGDDQHGQRPGQDVLIVAQRRWNEQGKGENGEDGGRPHPAVDPRHAVMPREEVDERMLVPRNAAVERGEDFQQVEEHIDAHGVGDDRRQRLHGLSARFKTGQPAQNQEQKQEDGRAGAEGRSQEARGHDGGEPVMAAGQTRVEKTGDGMDGERPDDGKVDQRLDPPARLHAVALRFKRGPADDHVEKKITEKHRHIPEHDGIGRGMQQHVERPLRLPEVHHDEQHAHDHRSHGHEFTEDDHALEFFIMVEIRGQNKHHRRSGHAHEIGELGDVEAPGHVAAHACDGKPAKDLDKIHAEGKPDESAQTTQPDVVTRPAFEDQFEHGDPCDMLSVSRSMRLDNVVDAGFGAERGLAADGEVFGQGLANRRMRIVEIAENHGAVRSFHARRQFAGGQTLGAEGAFFHHPAHAHGVVGVHLFHIVLRVTEVEAARAVGAAGHAETAADATVRIHDHHAVFRLERGLRGAHAHARRVGAVVAHEQELSVDQTLGQKGVGVVGKHMVVAVRPNPLHFLLAGDDGHVVRVAAGVGDAPDLLRRGELARVDDHGPAFGLRFGRVGHEVAGRARFRRGGRLRGSGRGPHRGRHRGRAEREGRQSGHPEKVSSAPFHQLFPLGATWQSQQ